MYTHENLVVVHMLIVYILSSFHHQMGIIIFSFNFVSFSSEFTLAAAGTTALVPLMLENRRVIGIFLF